MQIQKMCSFKAELTDVRWRYIYLYLSEISTRVKLDSFHRSLHGMILTGGFTAAV